MKADDAATAGQTTLSGDSVDTVGFDGACFVYCLGAVVDGCTLELKIQHSDSSGSGFADVDSIAVTRTASSDSGRIMAVEIMRPRKRYVRAVLQRGTQDATLNSAVAILTNAVTKPVTHDATDVVGSSFGLSPADE